MTRPAAQKQEQDFLAKGCGGVGWMSCKVVGLTGSQLAKVRSSLCRHYEDPWGVKGWPSGGGWVVQSGCWSMCEWAVLNYIYTWRPCLQERPLNGCSGGRWLPVGYGVWQAWLLPGSHLPALHEDHQMAGSHRGPHKSIWWGL